MGAKRSCSMPKKSKKPSKIKPFNQCSRSYQYKQLQEIAAEFHNNFETRDSQNSGEDKDVSSES